MVKFHMRPMFYSILCLPCQWLFCLPCQWLCPIYSVQPANFTAKYTTVNVTQQSSFFASKEIFYLVSHSPSLGARRSMSLSCFEFWGFWFHYSAALTIAKSNDSLFHTSAPDGTFQIHLTRKGAHHVFGWIPINTDPPDSSSIVALCTLVTGDEMRQKGELGLGRRSSSIFLLLCLVVSAGQAGASAIGWGAGAVSQVKQISIVGWRILNVWMWISRFGGVLI